MSDDSERVTISLVLPICNESAYIKQGVRAIPAQDYLADHMEILVADGMFANKNPKSLLSWQNRIFGFPFQNSIVQK